MQEAKFCLSSINTIEKLRQNVFVCHLFLVQTLSRCVILPLTTTSQQPLTVDTSHKYIFSPDTKSSEQYGSTFD